MIILRSILKYTPAVVLGILVVAWVASSFVQYDGLTLNPTLPKPGDGHAFLLLVRGSLMAFYFAPGTISDVRRFYYCPRVSDLTIRYLVGQAHLDVEGDHSSVHLPILCLLTAVLPLALGPFLSFRFRLWHYLTYTALVAVELAYYLRWQE